MSTFRAPPNVYAYLRLCPGGGGVLLLLNPGSMAFPAARGSREAMAPMAVAPAAAHVARFEGAFVPSRLEDGMRPRCCRPQTRQQSRPRIELGNCTIPGNSDAQGVSC